MQYIKESLRRQILETALREFEQVGYDGASMRSISEGAGTSLGNLYRYFRSKDALYLSCLMPVLEECIRWTGENFDVSASALALTAREMAHYVSVHRREFRIIVQGPARHYTDFLDQFTQCIARRLKQHAADHVVRNPGFYDAVALAFISSLRGIMEQDESVENTQAYILELMQFLFAGFDQRMEQLR